MSIDAIYTSTACSTKEHNLARRCRIFERHFLSFIREVLMEEFSGNIVEIGAGMGHKLEVLKRHFPHANCIGIEPSKEMRSFAQKGNISLKTGSLQNTGLPDASQDVICLFQMWHHIDPTSYKNCIAELKRILRPGGKIILLDTFAPEGDHSSIKHTIFGVANRFYAVLSQYPVASLRTRFLHAVMSICNSDEYPPENFGYFSPRVSEVQRIFGEVGFLPSDNISYGISQMFVFGNKS